jgi:hypothetical protein
MLSLLEIGNTIDGIAIAAKIMGLLSTKINTENEDKEQYESQLKNLSPYKQGLIAKESLGYNFNQFQVWKKRKCHCCMEYILDAGKALSCTNIIMKENPCLNIYCINCVISFMEEKHNYEENDLEESSAYN